MQLNSSSKILVTGGCGFLGRRVIKKLNNQGFNNLITFRSSQYDLKSKSDVNNLFRTNKGIDYVIHIAADIGGIGYSSKFPARQFYNNTLINTHIIHFSYKYKVKKFIGVGSVCEYPAYTDLPFKEEDIWNGYPVETNDAYGLSKRMMLAQSIAYNKQYQMNIIHLLMINLYGPNDNFDLDTSHVIPALIRKFHEAKVLNKPCVEIWGSGNVSREFLYVEDASNAIFLSLKNYNSIKPINIGNGKEIKIHKLAEIISNVVNYKGAINYNSSKPEGQKRRCLDISLAKEHLGFNAKVDLLTGIKKTYNFFLDNYTSN